MAELTGLTQKRGNLKGILTNIRKWTDKIDQGVFVEQMEARLEKIDKLWDDFNQVNDEIVILGGICDAEAFHEKFFETKALLCRSIRARNQPAGIGASDDQTLRLNSSIDQLVQQQRSFFDGFTDFSRSQTVDLRPPRVTIESFDGNYESWMTFRDLYLSSIHTNDKLSNAQKFKCLMSFLKGPAHKLLMNIPVTDANYTSAWEKLSERYNKPKMLIHALVKKFMDQGSVCKGGNTLRELSENADEVIRGLTAIGKEAESRDVWLIYLMLQKLDNETRMYWAEEADEEDYPTFENLLKFLTKRCNILEACQPLPVTSQRFFKPLQTNTRRSTTSSHAASIVISCPMCKSRHFLHRCYRFQALDQKARMEFITNNNLCINCLRTDHNVTSCSSSYKCIICNQPHHTMLHNNTNTVTSTTVNTAINNSANNETNSSIQGNHAQVSYVTKPSSNSHLTDKFKKISHNSNINSLNQKQTLLPTALIHVKDISGKSQLARALLDSGSQTTFISESCVQRLRLQRTHSCISINGLAMAPAGTTKGAVQLQLASRYNAENTISVTALILTRLTSNLPSNKINSTQWTHVKGLELADPQFNNPGPIDILIGADIFFNILCSDRIYSDNHPIAQLTIFGWMLGGQFSETPKPNQAEINGNHLLCYHSDIHNTLEKFWHLEEIHTLPVITPDDKLCEDLFAEHHSRDTSGRYIVRLPFQTSSPDLGNSLNAATSRLLSMERKFQRDESLKRAYADFMTEYLELGHMEQVPEAKINVPWNKKCYLPHHAVMKMASTTTKLRVVFDGSARTSSGKSLNDTLVSGPKLQQNLVNILLRFRRNTIAISADMEKMFRQVWVHDSDRDFQRIVWRQNSSNPICHYRLKTVTYGTKPASYLAVRAVQQTIIASRGITPAKLLDCKLWWYGPQWLQLQPSSWPSISMHDLELNESEVICDVRKSSIDNFHGNLHINFLNELFLKISSFEKIKRIVSYILRYLSKLKKSVKSKTMNFRSSSVPLELPTLDEMQTAEELCIKWAQTCEFQKEIKEIESASQIKNRAIHSLTPILDERGLLRVGGRLEESSCPFDTKHPIILPKNHVLSLHYIAEYHEKYLHPGPSLLSSLLRQRFWILGARHMIKRHISKCLVCFRQKSSTAKQLMGNLPKARVTSGRPFLSTGVDLAGPIYLKENHSRGRNKIVKGYIVLFICFAVKAVHIELVSDMTTEAYISALRRFISRRGAPIEITSDNGSNLVGSRRHLDELYKLYQNQNHINAISLFLTQNKIKFKFIPASAPHFGGLWEANIKSMKHHLNRVASSTILTYEEMSTLLTQIEAVLNSRPLCPLSEDVTVYDPLTPGHFLIGEALTAIPEPELSHLSESRLSRWQNIQQRVQGFWKTWSMDYLTSLQQRQKWLNAQEGPRIDQLVVIKDDNLPPSKWAMGRITQLHPGNDGLVRVVTIKTMKGELRRPIVKICPLPVE